MCTRGCARRLRRLSDFIFGDVHVFSKAFWEVFKVFFYARAMLCLRIELYELLMMSCAKCQLLEY